MPPNPQNLRPPWPKGVSGNTGGRPKKPFQEILEDELEANPEMMRRFIRQALQRAVDGDFRYWSAIFDRVDGKVASSIEISDKPQIDWSSLDNECDTPPRKTTDPKGPKPLPASGNTSTPVVARTLGGMPPGAGQGDDR